MSNTDLDNLNPLPISDRNKKLEKLSIKAFNTVLPVDKFTFRDERVDDSGVDGSLELEIDGKSTNLRSQVQLKSTDSEEVNQDGSISVQITTANLNYLLNGQSPIYILFVAPRNELYYVWARDERKRLDETNPNWIKQKTVTIRFKNLLTNDAINEIHQHIQNEAQLHRKINDILTAASNIENPVFSINLENLGITDAKKAKEILLTSGRLIVTSGYPDKVRSLAKILDAKSEKLPLILIVRAYAEQILGDYLESYSLLSKAKIQKDNLSEDDRQFLDTLLKNCEYITGRITIQEFTSWLNVNKENITGHFRQSYLLNQLHYSILTTTDTFQVPEIIKELSNLVQEILSDSNSSNVFKLYAKSVWLEIEGVDISLGYTRDVVGDEMRVKTGLNSILAEIDRNYNQRLGKWIINKNKAINEAENMSHKGLIASLKYISALVMFLQMTGIYSLGLIQRIPIKQIFETTFKNDLEVSIEIAVDLINEVIDIYKQTDNLEGELRAKMLTADIYEFSGRILEAKEIAEDVLPKAEALGYIRQIESAKEHIAGTGLRAKFDSSTKEKSDKERCLENANWTDEKLIFLATQMIRVYNLPEERYPIMEKEYSSIRDISKEKLNWCRFIEIWQDREHFKSSDTLYKKDPNRLCVCTLHSYQSIIQNPDWKIIIPTFKKVYCENCPDRNPLEKDV